MATQLAKCNLCKENPEKIKKCCYCKQHQNPNYSERFVLEVPISKELAKFFQENPREECIMKQELLGEFNFQLDPKLKDHEWSLYEDSDTDLKTWIYKDFVKDCLTAKFNVLTEVYLVPDLKKIRKLL